MIKALTDITRQEWIAFRWAEAPQSYGDDERTFISQGRRTPDEAYQAMMEWDETAEARECELEEKGVIQ